MSKEAMKLALEAFKAPSPMGNYKAITALEEALAKQEPAANRIYPDEWVLREVLLDEDGDVIAHREALAKQEQGEPAELEKAYSLLLWDYQELERAFNKVTGGTWIRKSNTPQQRTWVGLTDEEIKAMDAGNTSNASFYAGALWAEAKLKQKNGYAEEKNT